MKKYGIRFEISDSTLLDAHNYFDRKADAVSAARRVAKDITAEDIVRVWVDNTATELGVASFETRSWKARRAALLADLSA
jgi:uncharacterized protein YijF (DUF1287 family)